MGLTPLLLLDFANDRNSSRRNLPAEQRSSGKRSSRGKAAALRVTQVRPR